MVVRNRMIMAEKKYARTAKWLGLLACVTSALLALLVIVILLLLRTR
jgi:hypothetical protein